MQQRHFIERSTPLAEACLFLILNQVSTNAVWGRTLSPDKSPVTTADTTAELGCSRGICHQLRVSFDPPGCGSGMRVPALPEPCCHHGAQVGRLPYSLGGFPAVPPQRPSMLFYLIDKSLSHRHSCRTVAGKHHGDFRRKKTRKEAALSACSHPFRVFQNSRLFNSHGLFGLKKLCVEQMGIVVPMSTFSIPKKLGSQLSKSHRRENHL